MRAFFVADKNECRIAV